MGAVGWILILNGLLLLALGFWILLLAALQLTRQMFRSLTPAPTFAGPPGASPINLADLAKLIEAIIKMPQWLLALFAGDIQIYLGHWLATGSRLF